ncbi:hypothetical protein F4820DRAFT_60141 [Hypoxylon rubiginosum]|uniref:Uncharacterized protein n=1 Tax=Hypoxylon rubiginosum TaxID=110542 RepID=A0ACB9ZCV9_9PEZI|nr:hypothetical protein F4820DRAFT_60141 [Hypoxylon rubiginosum]
MPPKTQWSADTYRDIAVAVWDAAKLTPDQVDRVIRRLEAKGHTLTREALRQRFQKIIRTENAASGSNDAAAGSPNSGGDSAAQSRPKRKAAGKRKALAYDTDEDDEELDVKKKRVKKETRATKKKKEEDDEKAPTSQDDDEHWSGREEARMGLLAQATYEDEA